MWGMRGTESAAHWRAAGAAAGAGQPRLSIMDKDLRVRDGSSWTTLLRRILRSARLAHLHAGGTGTAGGFMGGIGMVGSVYAQISAVLLV
jgi:hypothetical protein